MNERCSDTDNFAQPTSALLQTAANLEKFSHFRTIQFAKCHNLEYSFCTTILYYI